MCTFDSPIGRCEVAQEIVLLDQTQCECSREHACVAGTECPFEGCFTPVSGLSVEHASKVIKALATTA